MTALVSVLAGGLVAWLLIDAADRHAAAAARREARFRHPSARPATAPASLFIPAQRTHRRGQS